MQAYCYWKNYPEAARQTLKNGLDLEIWSAEFSWKYMADRGIKRDVTC